jgi:hypothetical protein
MNDFYCESMPFEYFIRNVYLYDRSKVEKHFKSHCEMQNLMLAEQGAQSVKHLGGYEKQLAGIKKRMSKALDYYLKWKLTSEERLKFLELKSELEDAYSTNGLMAIVQKGITLSQPYVDAVSEVKQ